MLFYGVTFGGFVGLSNSLSIWFVDSFGLTPVTAGYYTAACVFTGSLVRPPRRRAGRTGSAAR
jgi:NNP family nitrate/nitrite transporter-like MFS transporter